jgi:hypothetical protein
VEFAQRITKVFLNRTFQAISIAKVFQILSFGVKLRFRKTSAMVFA